MKDVKKVLFSVITIFFSALSFSQVIPPNIPQAGLVAWYPFNGNANDESVNNSHGTVSGAQLTSDRFGNANSAFYFDGQNSYVEVPWPNAFHFSQNESFTLNVWIQPDSLDSGLSFGQSQRVFWKYSCPYGGSLDVAGIQFTDAPNIRNRSNSHNVNVYHPLPEVCKNWFMVTYVKDAVNDSIILYIDGNRVNAGSVPKHNHTSQIPFQFGMHRRCAPPPDNLTPIYMFEGKIDDGAIWDRQLTPTEISGLYDYNINYDLAIDPGIDELCPGDTFKVYHTGSPSPGSGWTINAPSGSYSDIGDTVFIIAEHGSYQIDFLQYNSVCSDTSFFIDSLGCADCLIGDYNFQSNTLDFSGFTHHGLANGGSFSTNRFGDPNSAFLFDGANDYIDLNNNQPIIEGNEFTIIAGAQLLGSGGGLEGDNIIFQQRNDIANAPLGPAAILFYAEEVYSSNSTFRIGARKDGNGTLVTADYPAVADTNWHCFAASLGSDDTLRLYLDNQEVAQTSFNQQTGDFHTGIDHVSLGTHSYANQPYRSYFNGKMDFVEIHDCYIDPLAVCQEWLCRNFEAVVINDSASFIDCPTSPVSVDSIQFGKSPYTFAWSNGDTTQQTFFQPGTHHVFVIDSVGCMWSDTFTVSSIAKPQLTTDTTGSACLNNNLTLMSSDSAGFYQKSWTIIDSTGQRNYSGDSLQVLLRESGHHQVTLYYTFNTCLDSVSFTFDLDTVAHITAIPEINRIPGCAAAEVEAADLDGFPPYQINWSNSDTGLFTLYDVGAHTVTLTDAAGCTHVDSFDILPGLPVQIDTLGPTCLNGNLTLLSNDTSGQLQKQWTVVNPTGIQTLSGDTVQMGMPVAGNYNITLNYSRNNCTDSVVFNFTLDTVPNVKAKTQTNIFPGCNGAEVIADSLSGYLPFQLTWSNNDTALSTLYDTGVHTVTITDAGNCTFIDTFEIHSASPLVIDSSGSACINDQLTLMSNDSLGLYQKIWSVTNSAGTQSYTGDTLQIPLPVNGLYNVNLVYNRHNCSGTSSFSFSINTVPGLQVITDVNYFPGCAGGPVEVDQITGYQPVSIQWSNNDTGLTTLYDSGFHTVTLTDAGNCVYTDTFYVAADSLVPVFDTLLGCDEDTLIISVQGNLTAYQNIWNVTYPGGFTTFGGTSFQYPIPDTGDYHFELDYSKYGCNFSSSLGYTSTVLDLAGNLNYQTNYFPGCEGALISTDSIVGGRPFYSALWSNGDTNFFSYFDTGYYYFSVTDTVECLWADTFYISPDTLSLLVRTEHQCPMDSICLQTTDTVSFLNKYWFIETPDSSHIVPGDTLSYFMERPGTYNFNMVYGKYGCSDTVTYSISPDSVEIFAQIDAQPNFFPGCAGALVSATSPQGEAPFEYLWSNTDTLNQTLYDTGTYTLYLIENRGCDTTLFFTVTPDSLTLTVERIPGCGTDTLYIQSTDSSGLFSKSWSQTGSDGSASYTGDSLYIPVTDTGLFNFDLTYEKNNCNRNTEITHQKSSFLLSVEATATTNYFPGCAAGEAEVINTTGGRAPYNHLWSNNDTSLFTLFDTGTHIVTVTDTLGCEAYDTVNIQATTVELFADTVHLCPLDSIFLRSNDTAALFTKQWFITEPQGGTNLSGDSISYFLNTPGTYFFDFEYNRHGCSDTLTYSVEPDTLVTRAQTVTEINYFPGCNGAMVNIINLVGESPYQFNWSNQSSTQNALHDTGTHSVAVTDARNCTWSDTFNIQTDSLTLTIDTTLACGTDTLTLLSSDAGGNFQKWWNISTPDSTTMIQGDTITFVTGDSGLYQFTFNYNKYNCTRTIYYEYDVVDMDLPRNILQAPANVCESDTFGLYIDDTAFVNTVEWHAPGGTPVTLNNSDTFFFSFPQAGNYLIEAYTNEWCKTDTHTYDIRIHPIPVAHLGPDTLLCEGDSFIINLQDTTFQYNWNNDDTTSFLRVLEADTYSVTITSDYCGFDSDDVVIDSVIPALVNLPPDSIMCEGDSLLLDAEVALGAYIWNTGDTTPQIKVHSTGIYSVTSTNLCRSDMDSIDLKFTDLPTVNLGQDTAFCRGDTLVLNARGDTLSAYVWTDQSTDSTFVVTNSGMYRVTATNLCGDRVKGIHVTVADPPDIDFGPDTILCPDDVHILDAYNPFAQNYSWNTGEESPQIQPLEHGTYAVTVNHICGIYSDSVNVRFDRAPMTDLGPDSAYCFGDLVELDAGWSNANYLWNTGSRDSIIQAVNEGNYWVQVTNVCGSDQDTVTLWFHMPITLNLGEDTVICPDETFDLEVEGHRANFLWNTGSTDSVITVSRNGIFTVRVENACGVVHDSVSVRVMNPPIYAVNKVDTACIGEELVFEVKRLNDADLIWFDGSNRPKRFFDQVGNYMFTLDNQCGMVVDSVRAEFQYHPEVDLGKDTLVCPGEELLLQAPNNVNYFYEWNTGNESFEQVVTQGGVYRVTVSTSAGCETSDEIRVADCGPQIFIPNAFSPNGDGLNDVFKIESVRLDKFRIYIFDRWGRELFHSTSVDFEWDGTYRGKPVNQGVYTYKIWYRRGDYKSEEKMGTVSVLR